MRRLTNELKILLGFLTVIGNLVFMLLFDWKSLEAKTGLFISVVVSVIATFIWCFWFIIRAWKQRKREKARYENLRHTKSKRRRWFKI